MDKNRDDQEQRQQKSSVDKANDFISKGKSAYGKAKQLRNAYRAARTARGALTTGEVAVATSEIWVPILLILLLLIFIIVLLSAIFGGNVQNTNGSEPVPCTSVPGASCQASIYSCPLAADGSQTVADLSGQYTCSTQGNQASGGATSEVCCLPQNNYTVPDCATIDQRLRSDFGVVIREAGETVSCAKRQEIYRIYSIPFQSQSYARYLKPATPFTLEFRAPDSSTCSSHAQTISAYLIRFWGLSRFLGCGSERSAGSFILHETGHVIADRNYTLFHQQFPYKALTQLDPSCFIPCAYGPQPKTYSLCWNNELSETFAETSSLFIYNYKVGSSGTISNFRGQCPNSWNYQRNTLFGGTIVSP